MRTIFVSLVLFAACSDDPPADFAGNYSVNVTNKANACEFDNWTEGDSSTGIPVVITQTKGSAKANVQLEGAVGAYVEFILGSRTWVSDVSGNRLDGQIIGTTSGMKGNCTFQLTADLDATLSRDTISGTITYTPTTNHHADCGVLETCKNVQDLNGARPPQ